jgi:hypothetical protein
VGSTKIMVLLSCRLSEWDLFLNKAWIQKIRQPEKWQDVQWHITKCHGA